MSREEAEVGLCACAPPVEHRGVQPLHVRTHLLCCVWAAYRMRARAPRLLPGIDTALTGHPPAMHAACAAAAALEEPL